MESREVALKVSDALNVFSETRETLGDFKAVQRLGEFVRSSDIQSRLTSENRAVLLASIADKVRVVNVSEVNELLAAKTNKLAGIVMVGTRFTFEEVVLILTLRLQIDGVLSVPGLEVDRPEELSRIDDEIGFLAEVPENKSALLSAQRSIRSNTTSVSDHWLLQNPIAWP